MSAAACLMILGGRSRRTNRTKVMRERSAFFAKLRDDKWRAECRRKTEWYEQRRLNLLEEIETYLAEHGK